MFRTATLARNYLTPHGTVPETGSSSVCLRWIQEGELGTHRFQELSLQGATPGERTGCLHPSRSKQEVGKRRQHVLERDHSGDRDGHFWRKAGKEQALWLVLFRVLIKRLK